MGIGIKELLIILVIVVLLFGTKKLKGLGADLGNAIKGFRTAMKEGEAANEEVAAQARVMEGDAAAAQEPKKDQA